MSQNPESIATPKQPRPKKREDRRAQNQYRSMEAQPRKLNDQQIKDKLKIIHAKAKEIQDREGASPQQRGKSKLGKVIEKITTFFGRSKSKSPLKQGQLHPDKGEERSSIKASERLEGDEDDDLLEQQEDEEYGDKYLN